MRALAVILGGVLLVGGASIVVLADQQRTGDLQQIRQQIAVLEQRLESSRGENQELAEQLTALRSKIAEQDAEIDDTTGFLK